jgi:predicted Zn-dependent peptidase
MTKNFDKLFDLFVQELSAVAKGEFSQQETDETKQFALGNFQKAFQTSGQLMDGYMEYFIFYDRIEDYLKIPKRIESLKRQDIIDAAKLCFNNDDPWGVGFYGAVKDIKPNKLKQKLAQTYQK